MSAKVLNGSDFQDLREPEAKDRARFRVLPFFGGVEVLDADFHSFNFAPHTHETPMLGVMLEGVKRFRCGRRVVDVGPGDLSLVNPGEVHTGGGTAGRLRYIALYPSPALMAAAGLRDDAAFRSPSARLASPWRRLAGALRPDAEDLEAEVGVLDALSLIAAAVGEQGRQEQPRACAHAVRLAREAMQARLGERLRLEELAAIAGVGPRHLCRSFTAETGLSPQRYLLQTRIKAAAQRLRDDEPLADVAAATGFADQAHMTRAFRAAMGAPPGAYRAAYRS